MLQCYYGSQCEASYVHACGPAYSARAAYHAGQQLLTSNNRVLSIPTTVRLPVVSATYGTIINCNTAHPSSDTLSLAVFGIQHITYT